MIDQRFEKIIFAGESREVRNETGQMVLNEQESLALGELERIEARTERCDTYVGILAFKVGERGIRELGRIAAQFMECTGPAHEHDERKR